ncbi:MAG: phosphatidylserine decarboxylase [Neisseriaceae bacterium]
MKYYPHPIIAKEGWFYIILSSLVAVLLLTVNFWLAVPFILIAIFVIQFFRDPAREIPNEPNIIVSPADGKVICVEQCYDIYQERQAIKISIFMNVFNVHSNRSPAEGLVEKINYIPGKFINADFDKASTENERNAIVLKLANNDKITFVQIAGLVARRILCYTSVGENLTRGQRYGFIRFGSRVDIYLPLNYKACVSIGQKVKASSDIIARF